MFNGAYFVAFVGLAVALVALYSQLAPRTGRFGLVAFVAALAGTMTQGGNMWFDGFAAPWLAAVAPQVFTAEKTITLQVGALAAYLLFALGWMPFGIAVLRARVVPVAIPVALVIAGALGYQSGLSPYGVPIGLAVAALGAGLIPPATAPARCRPRGDDVDATALARRHQLLLSSSSWPTRSPGGPGSGTKPSTRSPPTPPTRRSARSWPHW